MSRTEYQHPPCNTAGNVGRDNFQVNLNMCPLDRQYSDKDMNRDLKQMVKTMDLIISVISINNGYLRDIKELLGAQNSAKTSSDMLLKPPE
ncbi:MAG: hypothetical protein ACK40G_13740 [Cytophagaceae bacterium]